MRKRQDLRHLRPLRGGEGHRGGPAPGQRPQALLLRLRHHPPSPDQGEVDGETLPLPLSREQFQRWIDEDAFLEHAEFVGNLLRDPQALRGQAAMAQGRDVMLDIEIQGAEQVHRQAAGGRPHLRGPAQLGGAGAPAHRPGHRGHGEGPPPPGAGQAGVRRRPRLRLLCHQRHRGQRAVAELRAIHAGRALPAR